mgnify:CR=1 FL=1
MSTRTNQQNRALHKYFDLLASTLNAKNLTVDVVLKPDTEWNKDTVKALVWKPIQEAVLGKQSTTKMTTKEVTEVYDVLNKALGEKLGVHVEFPHIEEEK